MHNIFNSIFMFIIILCPHLLSHQEKHSYLCWVYAYQYLYQSKAHQLVEQFFMIDVCLLSILSNLLLKINYRIVFLLWNILLLQLILRRKLLKMQLNHHHLCLGFMDQILYHLDFLFLLLFSLKLCTSLFNLNQEHSHHLLTEVFNFLILSHQGFFLLFQSIYNLVFHKLMESNQRLSSDLT